MTKAATDVVCFEKPKNPGLAVSEFFRTAVQTLAIQRCRLIHRSISRPVAGKYRCWRCLREFETGW